MSLGDRLGLAGVVLAFFAIAAPYLWPDKKWIGWLSLWCAIVLVGLWGWLEIGSEIPRLRDKYPGGSALVIFVIGGCLALAIWQMLPKERAYLFVEAFAPPMDPYPENTSVGCIAWHSFYFDVRLDLTAGPGEVENVDFTVKLDTSIAAIGQISQFAGIEAFPAQNFPQAWLSGTDLSGAPVSIPITPIAGAAQIAPAYRVHCSGILANSTVHLVIASVAVNPAMPGNMPKQLFAPRRPPKQIQVEGTYWCSGKKYPLQLHKDF